MKNHRIAIIYILVVFFLLVNLSIAEAQTAFTNPKRSESKLKTQLPVAPEVHNLAMQSSKNQRDLIAVGQPMPNFLLKNVEYHSKSQLSLEDFKGRWLVLDFWTSTCLVCFASFPGINRLQSEFKENVSFVLVGDNEHKYGKNVRTIYERLREKQKLNLTVAYDSTLFELWKINAVPYSIIIDPMGKIRVINATRDLNQKNLRMLIEQNDDSGFRRETKIEMWDPSSPFLVSENGGKQSDFIFRSLLSKWNGVTWPYLPPSIKIHNEYINERQDSLTNHGMQISGAPINRLYMMAYFGYILFEYGDSSYGKISSLPIFEGIDSSKFQFNSRKNINLFNYSLTVPRERANARYIMSMMQKDLNSYFNFNAKIEDRLMPYWSIKATERGKRILKSKGKTYINDVITNSPLGTDFGNYPLSKLIRKIWSFHSGLPPFIDETGIEGNIDIKFEALMTDIKDVAREFERHGLILSKSTKSMKVLVITPKDSNSQL